MRRRILWVLMLCTGTSFAAGVPDATWYCRHARGLEEYKACLEKTLPPLSDRKAGVPARAAG